MFIEIGLFLWVLSQTILFSLFTEDGCPDSIFPWYNFCQRIKIIINLLFIDCYLLISQHYEYVKSH